MKKVGRRKFIKQTLTGGSALIFTRRIHASTESKVEIIIDEQIQ